MLALCILVCTAISAAQIALPNDALSRYWQHLPDPPYDKPQLCGITTSGAMCFASKNIYTDGSYGAYQDHFEVVMIKAVASGVPTIVLIKLDALRNTDLGERYYRKTADLDWVKWHCTDNYIYLLCRITSATGDLHEQGVCYRLACYDWNGDLEWQRNMGCDGWMVSDKYPVGSQAFANRILFSDDDHLYLSYDEVMILRVSLFSGSEFAWAGTRADNDAYGWWTDPPYNVVIGEGAKQVLFNQKRIGRPFDQSKSTSARLEGWIDPKIFTGGDDGYAPNTAPNERWIVRHWWKPGGYSATPLKGWGDVYSVVRYRASDWGYLGRTDYNSAAWKGLPK